MLNQERFAFSFMWYNSDILSLGLCDVCSRSEAWLRPIETLFQQDRFPAYSRSSTCSFDMMHLTLRWCKFVSDVNIPLNVNMN